MGLSAAVESFVSPVEQNVYGKYICDGMGQHSRATTALAGLRRGASNI